MSERVIRLATREVDDSLVVYKHEGMGHLCIRQGERHVCDNSTDQIAWAWRRVMEIRDRGLASGRVAMLGGGFCVAAEMLGPDYDITVFEIDAGLREFCPDHASFVVGDWRETFKGKWDAILYDIAEELSMLDEQRLSEAGWLLR